MSNTYTIANTTMIGTTSGFNGTSYGIGTSTTPYTLSNSNGYSMSPNVTINIEPPSLEVKGKIIHNGQDLEERLKTIEKVLMIPERDAIMEAKYPSLKKKYDEYIKTLEQCRMLASIKGDE